MKLLIFILMFFSGAQAQKKYMHGQSGIELFYKDKDTTYVYHQHQAKMEVRGEVATIVLNEYLKKKKPGGVRVICTSYGEVRGFLKIIRKPKMVVLDFQYISVLWNDGTLEETIIKKEKWKG
jgi:hypothetical protein